MLAPWKKSYDQLKQHIKTQRYYFANKGPFSQSYGFQLGFPGGSEVKASACNAGDPGFIPGSGRFPGEGKGHPLQFSCLENSMGYNPRGCKESDRLSNFTFTFFSEYPFTGSWLEHPSSSLQVCTSFCPSDLPPQPSFCRM